jgi:hypothetical protein
MQNFNGSGPRHAGRAWHAKTVPGGEGHTAPELFTGSFKMMTGRISKRVFA